VEDLAEVNHQPNDLVEDLGEDIQEVELDHLEDLDLDILEKFPVEEDHPEDQEDHLEDPEDQEALDLEDHLDPKPQRTLLKDRSPRLQIRSLENERNG